MKRKKGAGLSTGDRQRCSDDTEAGREANRAFGNFDWHSPNWKPKRKEPTRLILQASHRGTDWRYWEPRAGGRVQEGSNQHEGRVGGAVEIVRSNREGCRLGSDQEKRRT